MQQLTIKKIINGGFGLSHLPTGQVVLVPRVLDGEVVDVKVEERKTNHLFGGVARIVTPHKARKEAPCIYYQECGGCDLQHCDITTQLEIKKNILQDLLSRSQQTLVKEAVNSVLEPLVSPAEFAYRQRIRLKIDGYQRLGFNKFRSHTIVPIKKCLLAAAPINSCLNELSDCLDFQNLAALSTEIELQLNPQSQEIVVLIHFNRKPRPGDISAAKAVCKEIMLIERIFFLGEGFQAMGPYSSSMKTDSKLMTLFYEEIGDPSLPLSLQWEAGGFCQVNLNQNRRLIELVLNFAGVNEDESVLDLFCGMGNFAIPLARDAKNVTGIEGQGASIRCAKLNAQNNGVTNTEFIKSPIHNACSKMVDQKRTFDCVIIDPPRQGVPGLAPDLAKLTRKRLIYISCDPATLCRDLADLTESGFVIDTIQPVDMFPQTHHIETVVTLRKHNHTKNKACPN